MKIASLRGRGLSENVIFDNGSLVNRDNCFAPYVLLKNELLRKGIILNTVDVNSFSKIDLELHQDVHLLTVAPVNYLLMFETSFVLAENGFLDNFKKYQKIFTWRDDLVDGKQFIKINFPNPILVSEIDGWGNRNRFCCLISSNRTLAITDKRILYPERVKVIRWFEINAPEDFDLYGIGWDIPVCPSGLYGKIFRRFFLGLNKLIRLRPFPSYRGKVAHKRDVLLKTRFSICYENVRDLPGYITEKIFDSFFSGCVPVYWGASNITNYIPADCFIDRRKFKDTEAVYKYLKAITEEEFLGYQQRIAGFLASDAAKPFGSEAFAETIVSNIVEDLED